MALGGAPAWIRPERPWPGTAIAARASPAARAAGPASGEAPAEVEAEDTIDVMRHAAAGRTDPKPWNNAVPAK